MIRKLAVLRHAVESERTLAIIEAAAGMHYQARNAVAKLPTTYIEEAVRNEVTNTSQIRR
jgi:hypothetical protein